MRQTIAILAILIATTTMAFAGEARALRTVGLMAAGIQVPYGDCRHALRFYIKDPDAVSADQRDAACTNQRLFAQMF